MNDNCDVRNLTAKRWENGSTDPADWKPTDALEVALEEIRSGAQPLPDHIIICIGRNAEGGGNATRYYQAGNMRYLEQVGLLEDIKYRLQRD